MGNSQSIETLIRSLEEKQANALIEEKKCRISGKLTRAEFFKGRYTMAQFVLSKLREVTNVQGVVDDVPPSTHA